MCNRSGMIMLLGMTFFAALGPEAATAAGPVRQKHLDLSYIAADVCGVIVVHPQQMTRSPEVAGLLKHEPFVAMSKRTGFDPLKIEEIVGQVLVPPQEPGSVHASVAVDRFVVRFSPSVDIDAMAKLILPKAGPRVNIGTTTVAGKKCCFEELPWRAKTEAIACVADDRTVLVCLGGEAELKKMLARAQVKSPLVERLRRLDASDDVAAVFSLEPMRELIEEGLEKEKRSWSTSPGIPFFEMLLLLRSATVKVDFSDDAHSSAILEAEDAAGAAKVEDLVKAFRQAAKDKLAIQPKSDFQNIREVEQELKSAVEELLGAMTCTRNKAQVTATLKGGKGLMGKWFATQVRRFFAP